MKLSKIFEETLNENNVWKKLGSMLKQHNQLDEGVGAQMSLYLAEANKVIFDKFNINPNSEKGTYFIAGSARFYLYPELVVEMIKLDSSFPSLMGDLDIVIPNHDIWRNAGLGELLETGIYRPKAKFNIEAFTLWDPKKAGGAYANVEVRSQSDIIASSELDFGYWFMGLEDVLDYKGQMGRTKEKPIADLINKHEQGGTELSPEERSSFLKDLAIILTGKYNREIEK